VARLAGVIPIQLTYFWGDTVPGWELIWGALAEDEKMSEVHFWSWLGPHPRD